MGDANPQSPTPRKPLDEIPPGLVAASDYERLAPEFIEHAALEHIASGSGSEQTLRANTRALAGIELYDRILQDVEGASTRLTLLGQSFEHPVLLAPVSAQTLVHPQGELATARGAARQKAGLVVSTLASRPIEEIGAQTDAPKWFQLYIQPSRDSTRALIRRAEDAGYEALMVTLNVPIQALTYRAKRAGFVLPAHARAVNLQAASSGPQAEPGPGQSAIFQGLMRQAPDWDELAWVLGQTSLPTLAKGITHPGDARRLVEMGIDGIVVSNHGGRALDALPASIHSLPAIRETVGADFPVLMDGGIRSGYDVFKALAMGANAVMVGRLQLYALAVAGSVGVAHLIRVMRDELELAMSMTGCPSVDRISRDLIFTRGRV